MANQAADERYGLIPVLAVALMLAACSILYELLAAQTLSTLAANTVVWYSLVVGAFLASMGIGAFFSERTGQDSPWRALLRFEICLTLLGACTVPLIRAAHTVYSHHLIQNEMATGLMYFYGTVVPVVIVLGVLTGAELPLLMRIARKVRDESRAANMTLGWDYLGSLVGAILFPLVLLPAFNLVTAGFLIAAVNLSIAAWILFTRLDFRRCAGEALVVALLAAGLAVAIASAGAVNQYFLERYYYFRLMRGGPAEWFATTYNLPPIIEKRSPYQVIHMIEDPEPSLYAEYLPVFSSKLAHQPDFPLNSLLYLNGSAQTNTTYEEVYHEWFVHMPIGMVAKVPASVLVLGGGDGFLIRELLKYEGVTTIDHVDIDPALVTFAQENDVLRAVNQGALSDPRVRTLITDGYQYIRQTDQQYDAIYIDLPVPDNYDLAKLYSREFYEFVGQRLGPGGFAVFDSSGNAALTPRDDEGRRGFMPENTWPVFSHTLKAAGLKTIVPYFSTLELDNPEVRRLVDDRGYTLPSRIAREIDATIDNPVRRMLEKRKRLRRIKDGIVNATSDYLYLGFTLLAPEALNIHPEYSNPESIPLYVLTPERYRLSFTELLTLPDEVDTGQVNSIVRPTLPVTPWWRPRVGY